MFYFVIDNIKTIIRVHAYLYYQIAKIFQHIKIAIFTTITKAGCIQSCFHNTIIA